MFNIFNQQYTYSTSTRNLLRLFKVISSMLLTAHYCACVWYMVGYDGYSKDRNSWIRFILEMEEKDNLDDVRVFAQYSYSMYWSIVTLLSNIYSIRTLLIIKLNFISINK